MVAARMVVTRMVATMNGFALIVFISSDRLAIMQLDSHSIVIHARLLDASCD